MPSVCDETVWPDGLEDSFWAYERALMSDDVGAMGELFAARPTTLRGDPGGLLVGHEQISAFRRVRGGAPPREVVDVHVQVVDDTAALVVAVTAPAKGGRGLQTQLWRRVDGRWQVSSAHVSPPPSTFDPSVWRVVGDPFAPATGEGLLDGVSLAVEDGVDLAEVDPLLAAGACVRGITRAGSGGAVNAVIPAARPGTVTATAVALGAATVGVIADAGARTLSSAAYQGLWAVRGPEGVGVLARRPEVLASVLARLTADDQPEPSEVECVEWTSSVAPHVWTDDADLDRAEEALRSLGDRAARSGRSLVIEPVPGECPGLRVRLVDSGRESRVLDTLAEPV
ncbi:MAG: DUF3225 domain-containing protein [Aeromicrobium sp.]|uniref:AtzH-like domain-containing protein n=1 Tax=Aeromicrobium sp. TaxID=1871063 RepID=UPI0039E3DFF9